MPPPLTTTHALFAQGEAAPAEGPPQTPFFANPLFLIGLMALFFVVVILPARRREKREAAQMMASLKTGSKVILSGGIVGTVARIKDGDDEVIVRSDESKFRVLRSSIVRVLGDEAAADTK